MMGVGIVRTWVGSDCLWAMHHRPTRQFAHDLVRLGALQLTVADHLSQELAPLGLRTTTVPVIAPGLLEERPPPPWPERFTVLCYLPGRRRDFYGGPIVDALIEALPDVMFVVLGDTATDYQPHPNVISIHRSDHVSAVLARCSVLVRPTRHDGMPRMVLEALSMARPVIASHAFPHCHRARSAGDYLAALRAIRQDPRMNLEGCRFVRSEYGVERTSRFFLERLTACLGTGRADRRRVGRRQAVRLALRRPGMLAVRWIHRRSPAAAMPDGADGSGASPGGWHAFAERRKHACPVPCSR